MVYQEQVMQMAQIVGGYSLGGADLLRRAMGKKKPAEMAKHREIFREGAGKDGVDQRKADEIFDLMEKFAGYGFNKSHAAAYALVAYQTAWLKAHYPAEFMAATLSSDMDNTDKVVGFLDECARARTWTCCRRTSTPPTTCSWPPMPRTVRYGLGAVKGVGRGACEAIVAPSARQRRRRSRDLLDFCKRVDSSKLNRRALEALVNAGALDALGSNRASLMLQLPEVVKATDQLAQRTRRRAGRRCSAAVATPRPRWKSTCPKRTNGRCRRSSHGERETLGHYLSGHPLDPYRDDLRALVGTDLGELDKLWSARSRKARRKAGVPK